MILYENGFIQLEYDTSSDILHATCPDIQEFVLLQIHSAFGVIIDTIATKGIKKLILDCRNTIISVSDEDYGMVITQFVRDLTQTPLEQFARIITKDDVREGRLRSYAREMGAEILPYFAYRTFESRTEAEDWLKKE